MRNTFWAVPSSIVTSIVVSVIVSVCLLSGCTGKNKPSSNEQFDKNASYALGMDIGESMKRDGIYVDMDEFVRGIKDVMDSKTRYTMEEMSQILEEAFTTLGERQEQGNRQGETEFLAENSKRPGVMVTGSGLQYEVLSEGDGAKPSSENVVKVHYEASLIDGTVFDTSYAAGGEPIEFPVSGFFPGWAEGIQLMSVGSKYRFFFPSDLAFGAQGTGPVPPYSTLIFEVELFGISESDLDQFYQSFE